jgi:hypothetical protein
LEEAQKFAERLVGIVADSLRHERDISDLDIELQAERFAEEERNLRESLRNREIEQREFDLEMRRLSQDRSQFEQRVEEDRASFVARSWQNLTGLIIAEIQRQVAAWIAAQIIMGILSGGMSLIGPGVIGRASGGWVGNRGERGRDRVPAMLGRGEAVLNRHQQRVVESALLEKYGWGLDWLFKQVRRPHFLAGGGFAGIGPDRAAMVAAARPVGYASGGFAAGRGFDDSALVQRLERLEQAADRNTRAVTDALAQNGRTVALSVGEPQRARRLAQVAAKRTRDTDPRRRL